MNLRLAAFAFAGALAAATLTGCSSDSTGASTTGQQGDPGGPVKGPADKHCKGVKPQPTTMKVCQMGGMADVDDYPTPMNGTEGDDDDCKYHVTWSSTDVFENTDVTFTMTAVTKTDGKPAAGSESYIEAELDKKTPAPATNQTAVEKPDGTYTIGPLQFDKKGKWTIRFHLFEQCTDVSEESPHGHAAFFLDVP